MQQTSDTMNSEGQTRGASGKALAVYRAGESLAGAVGKGETDEEAPKFVFVDVSGPNRAKTARNRRLIHQHAMKEIGKSRRRPKKNVTVELDLVPLETLAGTPVTSSWLGCMRFGSGPLDPFLRFPIELDATARRLVAYMFDDELGQQRPLRDAWFTISLRDEATFSQTLSNSALHREIMLHGRDGVRETPDSIRYYTRAMASIRKRVDKADTESLEYIIGAVTGMMAHADILGSDDQWITHHKGLQQLVRARGGIHLLEPNEALRLTISWCELRGVYLLDQRPMFPLPRQWAKFSTPPVSYYSESKVSEQMARLRRVWSKANLSDSEWRGMHADIAAFSFQSFKDYKGATELARMAGDFGAWSNPMVHRLLGWRPAEVTVSRNTIVQETCRLGALLYLVPVWRFLGVSPVFSRVHRQKLKAVIIDHDVKWSHAWVVKLWSLYMGGVEALDSADEDWYVGEIVETLANNQIEDWETGLERVKEILWFECLFVGGNDRLGAKVSAMLSDRYHNNT